MAKTQTLVNRNGNFAVNPRLIPDENACIPIVRIPQAVISKRAPGRQTPHLHLAPVTPLLLAGDGDTLFCLNSLTETFTLESRFLKKQRLSFIITLG